MAEAVSNNEGNRKRKNIREWVKGRVEWYSKLGWKEKLLMTAAILAASAIGVGVGGSVGSIVFVTAWVAKLGVSSLSAIYTYEKVTKYLGEDTWYGKAGGLATALLVGFFAGRALANFEHTAEALQHFFSNIDLVPAAHAADLQDPPPAPVVDPAERFPSLKFPPISGLETLSVDTYEAKVDQLADLRDKTAALLAKFERIAPPYDPDLKHLRNSLAYYTEMHDKLEQLKPRFVRVDAMRELLEQKRINIYRYGIVENQLREELAKIEAKLPDGTLMSLENADLDKIEAEFEAVEDFYNQAKPGTVLYTDPNTLVRSWRPLSEIIDFKPDAQDKMPLSTARVAYDFWTRLEMYRSWIDADNYGSGPLKSVWVSEGWNVPEGVHHGEAHRIGTAMDFAIKGKDYSIEKVSRILFVSHNTPGCTLFFEAKNDAEVLGLQQKIFAELVRIGMPEDEAQALVAKQVRHVGWATDSYHFHMETPTPPVYAPSQVVAIK